MARIIHPLHSLISLEDLWNMRLSLFWNTGLILLWVKHKSVPVIISPDLPNPVRKLLQFKVHWKWTSSVHDTWEPYANLKNAPEQLSYGL